MIASRHNANTIIRAAGYQFLLKNKALVVHKEVSLHTVINQKQEDRMRSALLSAITAIALFITATAAQAEDLPNTQAPSPATIANAAMNWTGFYGGLNAGYRWSNGKISVVVPPPLPVATFSARGALGGAQIGYNYQTGAMVFGLEGDYQFSDIEGDIKVLPAGGGTKVGIAEVSSFGTFRARFGLTADRFMPYLTAGIAASNVSLYLPVVSTDLKDTQFHIGYVVGGGVEYAWTNNISTKLEALYVDLGKEDYIVTGEFFEARTDFVVIRAGLNYRF